MLYINSFCSMYSVCICSWWWDVHTCIYFVSSVVFVDFLIKSSSQKKISENTYFSKFAEKCTQKRNKLCSFSKKEISEHHATILNITIVTKHTVECTKLYYIEKKSPWSMLPNPPNHIPQRDVFQHLLFSKIIPPMFEHGFRSLLMF